MAIASARFGGIVDIVETVAAAAGSASAITRPVAIGASGSAPITATPVALVPGTGAPTSINVLIDGVISLAGAATLTIDLNSFTSITGTKTLTKLRGYKFLNTAAGDAGAGFAFTVNATASNGQTFGGQIPPSTAPATVSPNSEMGGSMLNTSGVTVDGTHKTITVTAGASGATGYFVFWGE